jgi:hypothetical protein
VSFMHAALLGCDEHPSIGSRRPFFYRSRRFRSRYGSSAPPPFLLRPRRASYLSSHVPGCRGTRPVQGARAARPPGPENSQRGARQLPVLPRLAAVGLWSLPLAGSTVS